MGFFSKVDYPILRNENNFVIGMFGGSKADIMSGKFDSLQMADFLKKTLPILQNKNIVVVSFASGCAKQPMQFARFARFAEGLDLAINLDGANELLFNRAGADITTPCMTDLLHYNNVYNSDYSPVLNLFFFYSTKIQNKMFESVLVKKSAFFLVLTKFVSLIQSKLASDLLTNLSERIEKSESAKLFPYGAKTDSRDLYVEGAQNWAKYAKLQFAIAREMGVPIIFALLPNILSKDSKSLTSEEKKHFEGNGRVWAAKADNFTRGYLEIKNRIKPLQKEYPNNFMDLTDLFKSETQMLYVDSLGHFNDEGSRLAWIAVIKKLKTTSGFGQKWPKQ